MIDYILLFVFVLFQFVSNLRIQPAQTILSAKCELERQWDYTHRRTDTDSDRDVSSDRVDALSSASLLYWVKGYWYNPTVSQGHLAALKVANFHFWSVR